MHGRSRAVWRRGGEAVAQRAWVRRFVYTQSAAGPSTLIRLQTRLHLMLCKACGSSAMMRWRGAPSAAGVTFAPFHFARPHLQGRAQRGVALHAGLKHIGQLYGS